ncbi:MAG: hypothetical protein ACFB03_04080 [Paracoccaceae bacterium]
MRDASGIEIESFKISDFKRLTLGSWLIVLSVLTGSATIGAFISSYFSDEDNVVKEKIIIIERLQKEKSALETQIETQREEFVTAFASIENEAYGFYRGGDSDSWGEMEKQRIPSNFDRTRFAADFCFGKARGRKVVASEVMPLVNNIRVSGWESRPDVWSVACTFQADS